LKIPLRSARQVSTRAALKGFPEKKAIISQCPKGLPQQPAGQPGASRIMPAVGGTVAPVFLRRPGNGGKSVYRVERGREYAE